jgi:diguanylate cyclase (GGDEF)-like protein
MTKPTDLQQLTLVDGLKGSIFRSRRPFGYLLLAIVVLAAAMTFGFEVQRTAAIRAAEQTQSTEAALVAMLDQETGMRGFLYTGQKEFLEPYITGQADYKADRVLVTAAAAGDRTSVKLAAAEDAAARTWQAYAAKTIAIRSTGAIAKNDFALVLTGKQDMDHFRAFNAALLTRLEQRRDATLRETSIVSVAGVVLLAGVLALFGLLALQLQGRRALAFSEDELSYRSRQRGFSDLVQAVDSEDEASELVKRHLERSLPGATVTVLRRNTSDNRLEASGQLAEGSVLIEGLISAEPRSCLAIRLGRAHRDGLDHEQLVACKVCSQVPGTATCQPLLVAGRVIGSVLLESPSALDETQTRAMADTVAQAAPVLANLRSLAIAESRASTDVLTGLPNRRAMIDAIKRMAALSARNGHSLAAIAFDLDQFKKVNDDHGHETGDAALAAVGEILRETIRESDFAARIGGEEFVVLAPGTDAEGGRVLAEKLRGAIFQAGVPNLSRPLTASFGVAAMPDHATTSEVLLRRADRASYLAKERGRNRVEVASSVVEEAPNEDWREEVREVTRALKAKGTQSNIVGDGVELVIVGRAPTLKLAGATPDPIVD